MYRIYSTDFCIKFHENPSSRSRTDGHTDGRTDKTKLTVALRHRASILPPCE